METMNIGDAAEASGVSAKMIRHYEALGLIPKARRTVSGYRVYTDNDVHTLRFIRQARDLGFPTKRIGDLVSLWRDRRRPSRTVKALAEEHLLELNRKLLEMQTMKNALEHLVHCCHGDDRPDCPIIDTLSLSEAPPSLANGAKRRTGNLRRTL